MKSGITTAVIILSSLILGVLIESRYQLLNQSGDAPSEGGGNDEILYWVAPMDANYRRDGPGKSPMGMDLVPVYANQAGGYEEGIQISPVVEHNLGVRTALVERGPLWRRVDATGHITFDESMISHIHQRTQGWIEALMVESEGERVEKGDLLFELYSPDVVNAQKEYLQARRRGESTLIAAADEKLRALGVSRQDIAALANRGTPSETIRVVAPQSGIIAKLNVREGMHVMPSMEVMSIADLSSVWLNAEIFESQVEWVARDMPAEARLNYLPGRVYEGSVDYIYPVLDPMTRTLKVRLQFDNPDEQLKPNMYARVSIYAGAEQDLLSVPREAIIRSGDMDRVVISLGEGRYRAQEVLIGIESGDWVEIRRGLNEGDEIVTSAQFLLDSEASISGSIRRLSDVESTPPDESIFASGVIMAVDGRTLTIDHDPVEALGWPAMTMDFQVDPHVDLTSAAAHVPIHFSIRKDRSGQFLVDVIHYMNTQGGDSDHD